MPADHGSHPSIARRLASFALGLRRDDLSPARQEKVSLILADFLGCVLAGSVLPEASTAFVLAQPGPVRIPGAPAGLSAESAAIAMGALGSLLQLHDGFGNGGNHPSNSIIPAVWCMREGQSMEAVHTAIAVGYEVANRLAASAHPALTLAGLAPTSCTGAIGAAAALGRLLELDEATLVRALSNAAFSFPAAALRGLTGHGSAVPLHGGLAARCALEAVRMAQAGLCAGDRIFDDGDDPGVLAVLHSRGFDCAPETWRGEMLDGVYFKAIPACRHAQPAIDAIEAIWREGPLAAEDIVRVDLHTYPVALRFGKAPNARHELYDRLMSVVWAVASALRHGRYDLSNVRAPAIDPAVCALYDKIHLHVDEGYSALYPRFLPARVELTLSGGQRRTGLCMMEYGTPSEHGPYSPLGTNVPPLGREGVKRKFLGLAQAALEAAEAEALWREVRAVPGLSN
ncbi:MAG: MmgE/PrpD family protein [Pigmentiphaga sp.]|uniref:MmgE/PrpD family protein n=1 Tax=Pigmentiphaga sp. TaxID=1977564 RepID=UPI0029A24716|nr:MmgE/PrpD family protein [Pigmentiphaga sp.]MDX3905319.1 MmgE/PrpD family protein [Pigmentiphaga sp.]